MRQIGGVFFGKGEILVKLWFNGLNYHNFHIFLIISINISPFYKNTPPIYLILHQFNLYVLLVSGKQIGDD